MSNMYCCVPGCNSWAKKNPEIHFHEFPKPNKNNVSIVNRLGIKEKVDQHLAWVLKLRIGKKVRTKYMYVCSLHFDDTDYFPVKEENKNMKRRNLKRYTVPSKNLPSVVVPTAQKNRRRERRLNPVDHNFPSTSQGIQESAYELDHGEEHTVTEMETADILLDLSKSQTNNEKICLMKEMRDFSAQVNTPNKITISNLISTETGLNSFTGLKSFTLLSEIVRLYNINFPDKKLRQLSIKDRIILTFVKLKTDLTYVILCVLFGISRQTCEYYIQDMIPKLAAILKPTIYFPSSDEIKQNLPICFEQFSNVRVILDCTEIYIQRPKCLCCRVRFYSHYKSNQTIKFMVGVSPAGTITFISKPYGGRASDKIIFEDSDIIFKLDQSKDAIMVDKGFLIDDICASNEIQLIRPPFLKNLKQLSAEDAKLNADIAAARVHIERVNQRIKIFKILSGKLQWTLVPQIENIFIIACGICNLSSPILATNKFLS